VQRLGIGKDAVEVENDGLNRAARSFESLSTALSSVEGRFALRWSIRRFHQ